MLSDIRQYGWHCLRVSPRAHPEQEVAQPAADGLPENVSFTYTVGVWLSLGHPEIILVGAWSAWHGILAAVVDLIKDGQRFAVGDESGEVLEGYAVRFGAVSLERRDRLLTFADWASGRRGFEAVELILPDPKSRWPEDPFYASHDQPLLA